MLYYAFTTSIVGRPDYHRLFQFFEICYCLWFMLVDYSGYISSHTCISVKLAWSIISLALIQQNCTLNYPQYSFTNLLNFYYIETQKSVSHGQHYN